jgi:hypothetical protein
MGSSIIGERIPLGNGYGTDASPEKRKFGIEYYQEIQKLFDRGQLKSHPITVLPGRWNGIIQGLELLKARTVSAQKLVVFIENDA